MEKLPNSSSNVSSENENISHCNDKVYVQNYIINKQSNETHLNVHDLYNTISV